jgi:hypothetical protein
MTNRSHDIVTCISRALACLILAFLTSLPVSAAANPSALQNTSAGSQAPGFIPGSPSPNTQPTTAPWLADFPAFATANGSRHWILGRSSKPCLSENEALDQARDSAAHQLRGLLRTHLPISQMRGESESWLRARVDRELSFGDWIVDRSVSKVHRPYSDIWSAAILVDASGDRLAPVRRDYESWRQARTVSLRQTAGSLVGLCLAILAVYVVINAATKGYFRGRLRFTAALALLLGTGWLIWLANAAG